jgi:hypothetical protein
VPFQPLADAALSRVGTREIHGRMAEPFARGRRGVIVRASNSLISRRPSAAEGFQSVKRRREKRAFGAPIAAPRAARIIASEGH